MWMGLQLKSGLVGFNGFTFPTQHGTLVIDYPRHNDKLGYILPQHHKLVNFLSQHKSQYPYCSRMRIIHRHEGV